VGSPALHRLVPLARVFERRYSEAPGRHGSPTNLGQTFPARADYPPFRLTYHRRVRLSTKNRHLIYRVHDHVYPWNSPELGHWSSSRLRPQAAHQRARGHCCQHHGALAVGSGIRSFQNDGQPRSRLAALKLPMQRSKATCDVYQGLWGNGLFSPGLASLPQGVAQEGHAIYNQSPGQCLRDLRHGRC
jgi:hypothetical protein